jgi:hypothetical protein
MAITRSQQAALYYARRRRLALTVMQTLTPWAEGLTVTKGQYVVHGDAPFLSTSGGTAGSTAPVGFGASNDGGVGWVRVDIQSLLQFLYKGAPTP